MKHIIILFCLSGFFAYSQQLYPPITVDSVAWTNGTVRLANAETFVYKASATQTSDVELKAAAEIVMAPDAVAGVYSGAGQFRAAIEPAALSIVSFHPNGWYNIPRYSKFEMGVKLPLAIQSQINAFLNGQPGLNPYDPDQVKIECVFNGGAHTRYGFYYRDYTVQNNTWIEQSTDYTFRIRLAPEVLYGYRADINLYINGVLTETVTRYFGTDNSSNLGHLEMANGNLLKMQYNNGQVFFGIGQNVAYPIPDSIGLNCAGGPRGHCNSPYTFQKQRDYLIDLADNGGNFTRVRLDALNMLCEWPYRQELNTDPAIPNKPLSAYLNNYNDNQRYLWEYDRTFATMENKGIKAILCLLQDQAFSVDGAYDPYHQYTWNHNPYSSLTDTTIQGCKAFFTDPQSKATYQKWLFYVMARYGYSTSMSVWQMINETYNTASSNSASHLIEVDPSFNNDVRNWVCDMKYYLQQMYPLHPVTTGFVSPKNMKNFAYNCLNIWSSNSYNTYMDSLGKYRDDDHEGRANALIGNSDVPGYFPNYKPFFWGELGLADGINVIDQKSDREFHNTIWSSTFTGGISSGLYWNDWEQKYGINHRNNFKALRAFVDMIDFSQRLEPFKGKDVGLTQTSFEDREIHTWWMRNGAKNYVVGWTKNNSANWTQDEALYNSEEWDTIVRRSKFNENVQEYTCFSTNQNPKTVITGLLNSTNYKIKMYNTYDNANEIDVVNASTGFNGQLSFRRDMYSYINDPFNADYAFIIKPNSTWRMSNTNIVASDTIYTTTLDTVVLCSRFTMSNGTHRFNWSIDDNRHKYDSLIYVNYSAEGTYKVNLKADRAESDTIIEHEFVLKVSDKNIEKKLNQIVAFPNPANNYVYLYYDEDVFKSPSITCIDMLGRKNEFSEIEAHKFNTSNLANGLYLIKLRYANYEKTFKVNISH